MKITEETVRIKAYELWEASGRPLGSAEENWFAALSLLEDASKAIAAVRKQSPPIGLRHLRSS